MRSCLNIFFFGLLAISFHIEARELTEKKNVELVQEFHKLLFLKKDVLGINSFLHPKFTHHMPYFEDGAENFKNALNIFLKKYPKYHFEIKRTFVDGNYVIVHSYARLDKDDLGGVAIGIYRIEDGKIIEIWGTAEKIPEKPRNKNTVY